MKWCMVSGTWSHSKHLGWCCRPLRARRSAIQQRSRQASQQKNLTGGGAHVFQLSFHELDVTMTWRCRCCSLSTSRWVCQAPGSHLLNCHPQLLILSKLVDTEDVMDVASPAIHLQSLGHGSMLAPMLGNVGIYHVCSLADSAAMEHEYNVSSL
jgi:hypothetical protein